MQDKIVIRGAREHNLKNISLELPRDKLIVITGLSGSGKSTLAFDTLYAEGQRRYVESLSAYARQFLGQMHKPDVDSIDGLSPAISIEQKTTSKNPRSTVGTVTEIYDYLRLLFARIGIPYCPNDGTRIEPQTADQITNQLLTKYKGKKAQICAPVVQQKKGTYEKIVDDAKKEGFARIRVDGKTYSTDDKIPLDKYVKHDIDIIIDRIVLTDRKRLQDAVEQALKKADGYVRVLLGEEKEAASTITKENNLLFSSHAACPLCGLQFEELQPRMFSFNSPFGACEECHGLGFKHEFDPELIIPDHTLTLADGAVAAFKNYTDGWRTQQLGAVAKVLGFSMMVPVEKLSKKHMDQLLYGADERMKFPWGSSDRWEGVIPLLERLYKQTESDKRREEYEKFMRHRDCPGCHGQRLKPKILSIKVANKSIIDITDLSVLKAQELFTTIKLSAKDEQISKLILREINSRLAFLADVGLGYLTLSRSAGTLSGGEAQRIRLATQIGSNLTGVLYVLDEPSIGLHQRDNEKLIKTLVHLRDLGNTLVVVEHDEDTIRSADWVVDIGPGAGIHGGHIVSQGTPKQITADKKSLTGQYLAGQELIAVPKTRRKPEGELVIQGASQHNLQNIDVKIPLGVFVAVTGVSGSGKSTLITDILHPALMQKFYKNAAVEKPGKHKSIVIPKIVEDVIVIDQDPIGRTPRSNPATYTKVFDEVRKLFAATKEAKVRGYKEGRFSFNVPGGRCETCSGDGVLKIEMNFLPDVYIECEECKGKRYNQETLQVYYNGKNIADVLDMTVEEALLLFKDVPNIERKLQLLFDVGLTYIKLGQSSTTLSGGESQRIKISRELAKRKEGHIFYILDEPTTGLHFHDVKKLLGVLNRLVEKKNTVLVIEHNLDMIKTADWIIDLGPEGGDAGGQVIATGTPEQIVKVKGSYTGQFLKKVL